MKPWHSVSARLTLTLLSLTLGSLIGLSLILDNALNKFFVHDAQEILQRQANVLAQASVQENNTAIPNKWVNLTAQQGRLQVVIFSPKGMIQVQGQGVSSLGMVTIPARLIRQTLAGVPQQGQFWVATDLQYPWWLYSTMPICRKANSQVLGAVYVAMPLRRPKQFAQEVKGLVMGMAIAFATIATTAGLLLSRTLTTPLRQLHQQAQRLEAGDYKARSIALSSLWGDNNRVKCS